MMPCPNRFGEVRGYELFLEKSETATGGIVSVRFIKNHFNFPVRKGERKLARINFFQNIADIAEPLGGGIVAAVIMKIGNAERVHGGFNGALAGAFLAKALECTFRKPFPQNISFMFYKTRPKDRTVSNSFLKVSGKPDP